MRIHHFTVSATAFSIIILVVTFGSTPSLASCCNMKASPSPSFSHFANPPSRRDALFILATSGFVTLADGSSAAMALSPEEASTAYDSYAATYDSLDGGKASDILGIDEARSNLFSQAKGSVLEIGCGTGLNLVNYDPAKIQSLTLLDVSEGMLHQAKERLAAMSSSSSAAAAGWKAVPVKFVRADATSELVSRFGPASFDTVVDSFSFCVMGNQGAKDCLNQMRQVIKSKKDGGQLLLLENTRSSNPLLGLYQDATAEAAASAGGKGCLYNQDVGAMLLSTKGVQIVQEDWYSAGIFRSYRCQVVV